MKTTYEGMFVHTAAVQTSISFNRDGLQLSAKGTSPVECHALSQNGRRMAVAVRPGVIYFLYIPDGCRIDSPSSLSPEDPMLDADEAGGGKGLEIQMQLTHFRNQKRWRMLALRDAKHLFLACMDTDGQIEIWRWEGCDWHREKVKQYYIETPFEHGGVSLAWDRDPSVDRLHMGTFYHKRFYFERRRGWFGPYWVQSGHQIVQDAK